MKIQELRKKDKKDLEKLAQSLRQALSEARFKFSSNKIKNIKEKSNTKKEIARILTILNEHKNIKK
jgi:ribosomal protein L29